MATQTWQQQFQAPPDPSRRDPNRKDDPRRHPEQPGEDPENPGRRRGVPGDRPDREPDEPEIIAAQRERHGGGRQGGQRQDPNRRPQEGDRGRERQPRTDEEERKRGARSQRVADFEPGPPQFAGRVTAENGCDAHR